MSDTVLGSFGHMVDLWSAFHTAAAYQTWVLESPCTEAFEDGW